MNGGGDLASLRNDQQGWALVSVLLVVASLALFAAAAQNFAATAARAQQIAWDRAKLDTALDSGVNAAVLNLIAGSGMPAGNASRDLIVAGQRLHVTLQDERGLIDLNATGGAVLKSLFVSTGVQENAAGDIVAAILDWRSSSPASAIGQPSNVQQGAFQPRHGAFQSVDELMLVPGISREIFRRVAPALTVYSGLPVVDQSVAPREVLAVLNSVGLFSTSSPPGGIAGQVPIAGRTYAISVQAQTGQNRRTRSAVVMMTGDEANPFIILDWR